MSPLFFTSYLFDLSSYRELGSLATYDIQIRYDLT